MGNYFQKFTGLFLAAFILTISSVWAQAPLGFNYQGVALTNAGTPVSNTVISLRIALIESQQLGTTRFQETHNVNTDAYGQFSVTIGNGQAVTGKMSDVQWSKFPYYMKVELDLKGGTAFVLVGTSQLLSVPYALYANNAGAASISVDSIKNELATIRLVQRGDSIFLNNNRGGVFIPKISVSDAIVATSNTIQLGNNSITDVKTSGKLTASGFKTPTGTSSQYLMADGSVSSGTSSTTAVPYTGATKAVDLGAYDLTLNGLTLGLGAGQKDANTVFGRSALARNTEGYRITAIGSGAMSSNTTGGDNTGVGWEVLSANTTGAANTVIGSKSLNVNTTGTHNSVIGNNTMLYNITGSYNTALGAAAMYDNKTGVNNVSVGVDALYTNVGNSGSVAIGYRSMFYSDNRATGRITSNTAIGYESLRGSTTASNNTGQNNTAIGYQSLLSNTSGGGSVAIGDLSLFSNTSGFWNNAVGEESLNKNTTGWDNTSFGRRTLFNNVDGLRNTAIGNEALFSNINGRENIAIGYRSLYNTLSNGNVGIGWHSLFSNTTGDGNTAIGGLYSNTTGVKNNSFGGNALDANTTGNYNVGIGNNALVGNISGNNNTSLGNNALKTNTTGSNNTAIGYNADVALNNLTNATAVGGSAIVTASNTIQLGNTDVTDVKTSGRLKSNGIISNLVAKTSAYTVLTSDEIITADATSSPFTITLPTAVGKTGQTYTIKRINSGSNNVTVGTTSSQTIDGSTTYTLNAQYKYVKVVSNGANWIIVGNN